MSTVADDPVKQGQLLRDALTKHIRWAKKNGAGSLTSMKVRGPSRLKPCVREYRSIIASFKASSRRVVLLVVSVETGVADGKSHCRLSQSAAAEPIH
jgi:hypothetical protein